ncbi:MAG: hypothetical protein JWP14_3386 [Frankiales bacterium]|nr:hypothetical protein [Frankiales bacterium]
MTAHALPTHQTLVDPGTGKPVRALGWNRRGEAIWPVRGGSIPAPEPPVPPAPAPPAPTPPPPAPTPPPAPPSDKGFPENTPVAEMTTEQQVAYWKHHSRQHEDKFKSLGDVEALRAKAQQFDDLQAASLTEQERAVAEAKAAGVAETLPKLVAAEFRVQASSRLLDARGQFDAARLKAVLEPLDLTKFVTNGEVDEVKVKAFVDGIAPAASPGTQQPNLGLGGQPGGGGSVSKGKDAGLAEAERRFGKKQQ